MDKRKMLRIAAPVLIVLFIVGIWAFKNIGESKGEPVRPVESDSSTLTAEEETDFALDAQSMDMDKLTSYGLPIIVDFGAGWCGPCKEFAPILDAMHEEMLGKAIIKYVDTDDYPEIAREFPVTFIPTQVFINSDGTPYVPSKDMGVEFKTYTDKVSGKTVFTVHEGGLTEDQLRAILVDMGVSQ
ncbi:MAG: thioredoxin [Firmicutes bacterium HGW-Firmicutes-16]|nr:MAG: thioredoxin [Firmicutes bacterium HGW-Firmicutes-16]